jgi:two-component system cell cycle response regulator
MSPEGPSARPVSEVAEPGGCVLVADDDRFTREQLAAILRAAGHTVELCEDGQEAVSRVAQGGIDVVLLDVMMPRLSGTEACRLLKSVASGTFLPVMMVTSRNDTASRVEGLRLGADDYVGKPFDAAELTARVAGMLRVRRIVSSITDDRDRLLRRAVHDELTGLPNRRLFESRVNEERKRAERHHEPFACLLIGITTGATMREISTPIERLVVRAAAAVKRSVREGDVVARFGHATIATILPHTHFIGTIAAAERIHRDVVLALGEGEDAVAIGAALFPSRDARSSELLIAAAESALDDAWLEGGGNVCIIQQRKYLYTPGLAPPPRSERSPASVRRLASDPPPPTLRRLTSEPPPSARRGASEPPPSFSDPRDPGDRRG